MQITLKAARTNAGYTVREAAKEIGVSKTTISKWENNQSGVSDVNKAKVCEVYKINEKNVKEFN